jgi:hypothetical protein
LNQQFGEDLLFPAQSLLFNFHSLAINAKEYVEIPEGFGIES